VAGENEAALPRRANGVEAGDGAAIGAKNFVPCRYRKAAVGEHDPAQDRSEGVERRLQDRVAACRDRIVVSLDRTPDGIVGGSA
jgi:hypothetical protein